MSKPENIQFVSIKNLAAILDMSENGLKPKIPDKFVLEIGKAVRYDLYGIIDFFKHGENKHDSLIQNILDEKG